MTIKHDIQEEIAETEYHILLPVSTDSKLKSGFYVLLQKLRGNAYKELAIAWANGDREGILSYNGFMYSAVGLPILIIPVKQRPLGNPTVDLSNLCKKLAHHLRKHGIATVAFARSHWLNMRFTLDQITELIDALEKAGVVVHQYE